jgi:hypothetical protein
MDEVVSKIVPDIQPKQLEHLQQFPPGAASNAAAIQ